MLPDYVNIQIAHQWLCEFAPDVAHDWRIYPNIEVRNMAEKAREMYPQLPDVVMGQTILDRSLIDYYGLFNIALVNAGIPTPLSPMPSDIRYYTDFDASVIQRSQDAGYNAIRVDLSDPYDIQLLKNTDTVIATGTFHYLQDDAVRQIFNNFAKGNLRRIIFNHADMVGSTPLSVINTPIVRTMHDISNLLPKSWRIIDVVGMVDVLSNIEIIGSRLQAMPNLYNVYTVERCSPM